VVSTPRQVQAWQLLIAHQREHHRYELEVDMVQLAVDLD